MFEQFLYHHWLKCLKKIFPTKKYFQTTSNTPVLLVFSFCKQHQKKSLNQFKSSRLINSSPNDITKNLKLTKDNILEAMSESINKPFFEWYTPNVFEKVKVIQFLRQNQ